MAGRERNGRASGIDRMTVETLRAWLKANWEQTKADLLAGRYRPRPVRRVDHPKPGRGTARPVVWDDGGGNTASYPIPRGGWWTGSQACLRIRGLGWVRS